MSRFAPHELSARAIELVGEWSDGTIVSDRASGHHIDSAREGRLRIHSRSRASKSLRWFNVPAPAGDSYDAVVLVEFDGEDKPAAAWKLSRSDVEEVASSMSMRRGRRILKIGVGGPWTSRMQRVHLDGS